MEAKVSCSKMLKMHLPPSKYKVGHITVDLYCNFCPQFIKTAHKLDL